MVRGNDAPFVEKLLRKAIYTQTGCKIEYTKRLRKKTKWHIKSIEIFVFLWEKTWEKLP